MILVLLPLVILLYRNGPEELGQFVDARKDRSQIEKGIVDTGTGNAPPEQDPESLTLAQAARTRSYYILGLSNIIWAMSGTGVLFYLYTLCEERGLPEGTASWMFKIMGMTMLAMQLSGGVLADFFRLDRLFGWGTVMIAGSLAWLYFDPSELGAQVFAGLFGGGQGMLISVSGVAWLRFYGRQHLGSIRGAVWCGTVAGSGCGPLMMGWVKDATGSYDQAILCFASAMMPLAIAAWFIRPPQARNLTTESE